MTDGGSRETMDYDVVIVGGGPAGLTAAIRLKQMSAVAGRETAVCLLDKGAEIGAHVVSGALLDPAPLQALFPDWQARGCPLDTPVSTEAFYYLTSGQAWRLPQPLLPPPMRNRGAYIVSLSALCRWLAREAEALGVEIYPGFPAVDIMFGPSGAVEGVVTGDMGIAADGHRKPTYAPGMALKAKYVFFAEGTRGFLSEKLIVHSELRRACAPQHYGLGFKELWELAPERHRKGLAVHAMGWPLSDRTGGGLFLYHWGERLCSVGMVLHLNYRNPHLSPFEEFQRAKSHPLLRRFLDGGKRIGYGARAVNEGGWQSVPQLAVPGGALLGGSAGFMNVPRIKGIHNAMTSGIQAAEVAASALFAGRQNDVLEDYETAVRGGAIFRDLYPVRNVKPLWSRFGTVLGASLGGFDLWCQALFGGSPFGTLTHDAPDHACLLPADRCRQPAYPKPDGQLRFDLPSSIYLSGVDHVADQPPHLHLTDPAVPLAVNLLRYAEPAQRYCPAGVYEIVAADQGPRLQINAANCLHCKACEIKDPAQNIAWVPPEGGGGPHYVNM